MARTARLFVDFWTLQEWTKATGWNTTDKRHEEHKEELEKMLRYRLTLKDKTVKYRLRKRRFYCPKEMFLTDYPHLLELVRLSASPSYAVEWNKKFETLSNSDKELYLKYIDNLNSIEEFLKSL